MIKRISVSSWLQPKEREAELNGLLNTGYQVIGTLPVSVNELCFFLYKADEASTTIYHEGTFGAPTPEATPTALDGGDVNQLALLSMEDDALNAEVPITCGDFSQSGLDAFCKMAKDQNYIVLDTETTGLNEGEIVQIAIINRYGETLLNTLVKPVNGIPNDASAIHGITDEMVKHAPSWAEVSKTVRAVLKGQNVIVYNSQYDRKMMHKSAESLGIEKIDWKAESAWWCAMHAYAEFYGDFNEYRQSYRWQKLTFASQAEGVTVANAHTALGDCLMTLGVVRAMVSQHPK